MSRDYNQPCRSCIADAGDCRGPFLASARLLLILALTCLPRCGASRTVSADDRLAEAQFLVESLRVWQSRLEIYCTFQIADGTVDSTVAAAPIHDLENLATGVLVKSRGERAAQYRYELTYLDPNVPSRHPAGARAATFHNRNHLEVFGPQVGVTFDPHSKYAILRGLGRPEDRELRKQFRVTTEFGPLNPVNPKEGMLGCVQLYLRNAVKGRTPHSTLNYEVVHPDPEHTDLRFHEVWPEPGFTLDYCFRFRTNVALPYVDFVEASGVSGGQPHGSLVYLSDFVNSPVPVAKTVRRVNLTPRESGATHQCRVWTSTDLGERVPTEADFAIEIPAKAIYGGFKKTIDPGRPQTLRLAELAGADAMHQGEITRIQRWEEPVPEGAISPWIVATCLAVVGGIAVAALAAYRHRAQQE